MEREDEAEKKGNGGGSQDLETLLNFFERQRFKENEFNSY